MGSDLIIISAYIKRSMINPVLIAVVLIVMVVIIKSRRREQFPDTPILDDTRYYGRCIVRVPNHKSVVNRLHWYYKNNPQTIPKIIHQIWIGTRPVPYKWINTFERFARKHGWEHKLWRDKDLEELDMINKEIYNKEKTYHGKADIARLEILYKYGGIYIDADSVCLNKDLGDLIEQTNNSGIFVGREKKDCAGVANGVVGASKMNPGILHAINTLKNTYDKCSNAEPFRKSGPLFFDQVFTDMPITIFPYHYFYPVYWLWNNDFKETVDGSEFPDSYMYQYGYTTNSLWNKI